MLAERQVTAVLNVQRQDYFCGLTGLNPLESILQDKLGAEEWARTLQTLKCKQPGYEQ
jgi:hypothetical protein